MISPRYWNCVAENFRTSSQKHEAEKRGRITTEAPTLSAAPIELSAAM
jgi:hypothetical protein